MAQTALSVRYELEFRTQCREYCEEFFSSQFLLCNLSFGILFHIPCGFYDPLSYLHLFSSFIISFWSIVSYFLLFSLFKLKIRAS
jgi:hypothetical protein